MREANRSAGEHLRAIRVDVAESGTARTLLLPLPQFLARYPDITQDRGKRALTSIWFARESTASFAAAISPTA
ncbi:hypothetical protein MJ561_12730 [Klebsiella pneumoniae]|nr:hypothetical protein MJ561_12730 [Klebsiella pneumoniae]